MKLAGSVVYGMMREEECITSMQACPEEVSGKIFKPRSEAGEGDSHTKRQKHTHSHSKEMEISHSKTDRSKKMKEANGTKNKFIKVQKTRG